MTSGNQTASNESCPPEPLPASHTFPQELGIKRYGNDGLRELMVALGQPAYRAKQLIRWLYARKASSYEEMSDLPAALRERLCTEQPVAAPEVVRVQHSHDGTRKYLLRLADGALIETVALPSGMPSLCQEQRTSPAQGSTPARLTVCFSTQVGCAMACAFCATGRLGLTRQLAPGEMLDQLLVAACDFGTRVTNAVAMGEGEPLANYDATLAALRLMNVSDGLGIGARHLTLSTCGLVPQLRRLANEPEQFTLAVSLHSAVQATRDKLMPAMARYPLAELRQSLVTYAEKTGRRPTLEYALIHGVNDTDGEIAALLEFCKRMLVHVNLIPLNEGGGKTAGKTTDKGTGKGAGKSEGKGARTFRPASSARLQEVAQALQQAGIEATVRRSRGADIAGACGQLAATSTLTCGIMET